MTDTVGTTQLDKRLMAAALRLGARGEGRTWPNPSVGVLLVHFNRNGQPLIVGRGVTAAKGRPHGEAVALKEAGNSAAGATCYVTLEPCVRFGRDAPCAGKLIKARIARVVCPLEDPNPQVAGQGFLALRNAGIAVDTSILAPQGRYAHRGHIMRATQGRPFITLKMAVSQDGGIGKKGRGQVPITGEAVRSTVHHMRARHDAIMVGIGTARADNPLLDCRLPGLAAWSPVRVVVDARAELDLTSQLVASANRVPVWLLVGANVPTSKRKALAARAVDLIECEQTLDGRIALDSALAALARRGITRLMLEGGARLAQSFLDSNMIDEAIILRSPIRLGEDKVRAFAIGINPFADGSDWRLVGERYLGSDILGHYVRHDVSLQES